jgi:uncharacterized protein with beta-barrel porin domain
MKKITGIALLIGIVSLTFLSAGCGKSTETTTTGEPTADASQAVAPTSGLPETAEVMAALDKKDYDAVVAGLVKAKQNAGSPEQTVQFANLADDVKIRLLEDAPTHPKANEALAALRQLSGGR